MEADGLRRDGRREEGGPHDPHYVNILYSRHDNGYIHTGSFMTAGSTPSSPTIVNMYVIAMYDLYDNCLYSIYC